MPGRKESLDSAKTRLLQEQRIRTERRVTALLRARKISEDFEILDDSEEENRIRGRKKRANRDKATQTDPSSSSFCCGVIVGVLVVVSLLACLIVNDRQRMEK
jgi:hypothetical protein